MSATQFDIEQIKSLLSSSVGVVYITSSALGALALNATATKKYLQSVSGGLAFAQIAGADLSDYASAFVNSVAGTTGKVLINGGTSPQVGAVTVSLDPSIGPFFPNLYITTADYTMPANTNLIIDDVFEIGAGFMFEIGAGALLHIQP